MLTIDFGKFQRNEAMIRSLKWLEKNCEDVKVLTPVFAIKSRRETCSIYQGAYPVDEKFTATIAVIISYRANNKTLYEVIYGGYDCIRYKKCITDDYQGTALGEELISVEFIGDGSHTIEYGEDEIKEVYQDI